MQACDNVAVPLVRNSYIWAIFIFFLSYFIYLFICILSGNMVVVVVVDMHQ